MVTQSCQSSETDRRMQTALQQAVILSLQVMSSVEVRRMRVRGEE